MNIRYVVCYSSSLILTRTYVYCEPQLDIATESEDKAARLIQLRKSMKAFADDVGENNAALLAVPSVHMYIFHYTDFYLRHGSLNVSSQQ